MRPRPNDLASRPQGLEALTSLPQVTRTLRVWPKKCWVNYGEIKTFMDQELQGAENAKK